MYERNCIKCIRVGLALNESFKTKVFIFQLDPTVVAVGAETCLLKVNLEVGVGSESMCEAVEVEAAPHLILVEVPLVVEDGEALIIEATRLMILKGK